MQSLARGERPQQIQRSEGWGGVVFGEGWGLGAADGSSTVTGTSRGVDLARVPASSAEKDWH